MTPKEKANEIYNNFYKGADLYMFEAKNCALICVNEILKTTLVSPNKSFWNDVKSEIEKL